MATACSVAPRSLYLLSYARITRKDCEQLYATQAEWITAEVDDPAPFAVGDNIPEGYRPASPKTSMANSRSAFNKVSRCLVTPLL